jgi:hypothetical protein
MTKHPVVSGYHPQTEMPDQRKQLLIADSTMGEHATAMPELAVPHFLLLRY